MKAVWAGAVALALLGVGIPSLAPIEPPPDLRAAEVAFIGTSLTLQAVPLDAPPAGLLRDGRRHLRLAISAGSEEQMTALLEGAVAAGVREIFVEANPYLHSFRERPWFLGLIAAGWQEAVHDFGRSIRDSIRGLVTETRRGTWSHVSQNDVLRAHGEYDGDTSDLSRLYPLRFHLPKDPARLMRVLAEARQQGRRIVFIVFPRSTTAAAYLGAELAREQARYVNLLAQRYEVEVWDLSGPWPDNHFYDQAHVNERGRERFLTILRQRYGGGGGRG